MINRLLRIAGSAGFIFSLFFTLVYNFYMMLADGFLGKASLGFDR